MDLGNLGGLLPPAEDLAFNEVIRSYYLPINTANGATTDYPIPFNFISPAELDVIFSHFSTIQPGNATASGSPDGLACQLLYSSSTAFANFSIVGSALRVAATGLGATGAVRILRRNRRVKNSAQLAGSTTEAQLPFTISDPHKTMLVTNLASVPAFSHGFIEEYIPATDTFAWHLTSMTTSPKVKITSANTYMTNTTGATNVTIVEFE